MSHLLYTEHWDLISPDGVIKQLKLLGEDTAEAQVQFKEISPHFKGFEIDPSYIFFNLKSTLAQLGLEANETGLHIDRKHRSAEVSLQIKAIGGLAKAFLKILPIGGHIGKLFAADPRRIVRNPDYLLRYLGRKDRMGRPLLALGGCHNSSDWVLEKIDGRTVAYLKLNKGTVSYSRDIFGFLPTLSKSLIKNQSLRQFLSLNQKVDPKGKRFTEPGELLLVKTPPLHIRTCFAVVVDDLLPQGYCHTSARVLEPHTIASGDIYELYGSSKTELTEIPLQFYTLEPHREHVFFQDRDQLQSCLDDPEALFQAFDTAPKPENLRAAAFIVKGTQMKELKESDWLTRAIHPGELTGATHGTRQELMVNEFIEQQPEYSLLHSIDEGIITSQGILLSRYFPSSLMKRLLLSDHILQSLKGIYFQKPSLNHQDYFSHEDHNFMSDLWRFAIPLYWVDKHTHKPLQYVQKAEHNSGLFVPLNKASFYLKATVFGIYGSNLMEGHFEKELNKLLKGLLKLRQSVTHPLLNNHTPLALVTGGGPGAMEVGNRVARDLDILSCAHIVDFSKAGQTINEQHQNPHIDAKMTYRLNKLVERQADFNLDFPIFVTGGIGTDFELSLEEVRRKTGGVEPKPILLFGKEEYWTDKITPKFRANLKAGTIKGSEWISTCLYCVENAAEGLKVYERYFSNQLLIGPQAPFDDKGFISVKNLK